MTYLMPDGGGQWPRLEIENIGDSIVFTVWTDANTCGGQFIAKTEQDMAILRTAVLVADPPKPKPKAKK